MERTKQRARQSVYWPYINNDIENAVKTCRECQQLLPSLQKEPMKLEEEPTRPFQSVSTDYFDHAGRQFLIYTDRLSGWPMVQLFNHTATADKLISTLRMFFSATGVPEVLRSDGGPQYKSKSLNEFLQHWSVRHYKSSPYYPQSNGHAEASVKAVKYLIIKCTENGNIDTDKFALGLLELRNTPKSDGQSPAQTLFGHPIRSILPVHKRAYEEEWQQSKTQTKERREQTRKYTEYRYNLTAKSLPQFKAGNHVNIQDHCTGRWIHTGVIVEVGRNRQYLIRKSDGRLIWRNRRFIRRHHPLTCPPNSGSSFHPSNPEETPSSSPTRSSHSPSHDTPPDLNPSQEPMPVEIVPQPVLSKNIVKSFHKLPSALKAQPQPAVVVRRRQAPPRLEVNPWKKTYKNQ